MPPSFSQDRLVSLDSAEEFVRLAKEKYPKKVGWETRDRRKVFTTVYRGTEWSEEFCSFFKTTLLHSFHLIIIFYYDGKFHVVPIILLPASLVCFCCIKILFLTGSHLLEVLPQHFCHNMRQSVSTCISSIHQTFFSTINNSVALAHDSDETVSNYFSWAFFFRFVFAILSHLFSPWHE